MRVEKEASIGQDEQLEAAIDEASKILERELGQSAATARARWSLIQDQKGRPAISLTVSDWTGAVEYRFAPAELKNTSHMELRLHRLWGDLLQVHSHHQLDSEIWALHQQAES